MPLDTARPILVALLLLAAVAARGEALALEECRISAGPAYPGIKARCGELQRPLDPDEPGGENITLRIAVVPALNLSPEPDPVVPLAGGPGQGAVQFYAAYAGAFDALRRNRDILLVDQRGTGESALMDCPFDDDLIEGQYSVDAVVQFTEECLAALPHDPRYFTTSVAVADLEAVRAALGYERLNLYGVSYGTRVAQHFARRFPGSTRTVTLDGVVPPQIVLGTEIAIEGQRAVDNIFARCAADAPCSDRFPGVADTFAELVETLREAPVTIGVPDPSTGRPQSLTFGVSELAGAVRLLAYHPNTIALLPLLIDEAGKGNFTPLGSQFLMTTISMVDALALGMHNAVMCTEDLPFLDPSDVDYDAIATSYMGSIQLDALQAICDTWPAGPIDPDFKKPLDTDIPVLLLSGDADPITPPRYAHLAAVDLANARLLTGRDQGHGQLAVGCTGRVIANFVAAGDITDLDTDCMARSFVMPFFLDFSGPAP